MNVRIVELSDFADEVHDPPGLIVADLQRTFLLSGTGDLIEPDDGVMGIGSGSTAAVAAARALLAHTELEPRAVATEAMRIAAGLDIYTNDQLTIEEL